MKRLPGRNNELVLLRECIDSLEPWLLYLHGETGAGKTSLLCAWQQICADVGCRVEFVDDFEPTGERCDWLLDYREQLDRDCGLVVASRHAAPVRLTNGEFTGAVVTRHLEPLSNTVSRDLPIIQAVSTAVREQLCDLSAGNPLVLRSLAVAESSSDASESWQHSAAVLMHDWLGDALGTPRQRRAAGVASVPLLTTYEMFAAGWHGDDCDDMWAWIESRSFVCATAGGIKVDAVARWALLWELQTHTPAFADECHKRIEVYVDGRLEAGRPEERERWLNERLHLGASWPYSATSPASARVVRTGLESSDVALVLDSFTRRHGDVAAANLRLWLDEHPEMFQVWRKADAYPLGFSLCVDYGESWPAAAQNDPVFQALTGVSKHSGPAKEACVLRYCEWLSAPADVTSFRSGLAWILSLHWADANDHGVVMVVDEATMSNGELAWANDYIACHVIGRCSEYGQPKLLLRVTPAAPSEPMSISAVQASAVQASAVQASAAQASADQAGAAQAGASLAHLFEQRLNRMTTAAGVSPREREVLDLLLLGRTAGDIAEVLGISARTVKYHQSNLLAKLGAESRLDLFRVLLP